MPEKWLGEFPVISRLRSQTRAAPMAATETHYDVLGVAKEATVEEIRRVWCDESDGVE